MLSLRYTLIKFKAKQNISSQKRKYSNNKVFSKKKKYLIKYKDNKSSDDKNPYLKKTIILNELYSFKKIQSRE